MRVTKLINVPKEPMIYDGAPVGITHNPFPFHPEFDPRKGQAHGRWHTPWPDWARRLNEYFRAEWPGRTGWQMRANAVQFLMANGITNDCQFTRRLVAAWWQEARAENLYTPKAHESPRGAIYLGDDDPADPQYVADAIEVRDSLERDLFTFDLVLKSEDRDAVDAHNGERRYYYGVESGNDYESVACTTAYSMVATWREDLTFEEECPLKAMHADIEVVRQAERITELLTPKKED
ncbi:MAG: hypothetical protein CBD18_02485 [Opitutales bacterium TMED158]|nr:MAG: hypothetical protein CBD18_02485 [Opitutales bacterium TMED158]|tara:strand:- start:3230 stop:3937 length:708 start_codon:yes stop_codon:yes gene_type:complete